MVKEYNQEHRKWFTRNNISTIVLVALFVLMGLMIINPKVKIWVLGKILVTGMMNPDIPSVDANNLSGFPAAPDMLFKNGDNEAVALSSLKGKVIFLNFWATWCPPCNAEMPDINVLYKKFSNNTQVVFIMLDIDNNYSNSSRFMQVHQYQLPVYTTSKALPKDLYSGSIPTTVVINKEGRIVYKDEGAANYNSSKFNQFLHQLAEE
jgi:thiol-disulfide isomerase/thioredoxin